MKCEFDYICIEDNQLSRRNWNLGCSETGDLSVTFTMYWKVSFTHSKCRDKSLLDSHVSSLQLCALSIPSTIPSFLRSETSALLAGICSLLLNRVFQFRYLKLLLLQ